MAKKTKDTKDKTKAKQKERYSGPVFTVEYLLIVEPWQANVIDNSLEAGRNMYNSLCGLMLRRYNEMIKTKEYRTLMDSITGDKEKDKETWSKINGIRQRNGFNEYAFQSEIKPMRNHFKKAIDSTIGQKIASQAWKAFAKLIYGDGKKIHFKKFGEFDTLEGKTSFNGIKFCDTHIEFRDMKLRYVVEIDNQYEEEAIRHVVSYCRIVRKMIRGQHRYYVQLVMRGTPPLKVDKTTKKVKYPLAIGDVGLDIGTSTLAYASMTKVRILELASGAQGLENEKKKIQRAMDRSRRVMNPQYYNDDGTIKKGKKTWVDSNHYIKLKNKLKEINRKQAAIRKYQHECLANELVVLGNKFYVEEMNFKALAKRAKKTEKSDKTIEVTNKNGEAKIIQKNKRKKRFGKSVANRAPAMFLAILERKLKNRGAKLVKINTREARASQFNHLTQEYKKKKLSQRWNYFDGYKVQRDMYSAFLIMNIKSDLKSFNMKKCNARFANFMKLHDEEVARLSGNKNLSSIAI